VALVDELLVARLEDVEVQAFTRIHHNAQREYRNKIRHGFSLANLGQKTGEKFTGSRVE
jgi:hypothetical protein